MAGIGFTLKRLTQKDDLWGVVHAYSVAMLAAAGPWIFTIIALAGITNLYSNFVGLEGLLNFRVIIIYNFAFSLVLSAPIFMVATRYIADNIHHRDVTNVPSVLIGSMILSYAVQLPVGIIFYLAYVDLPLSLQISAMLNLFLLTTVWLLGVFLTALKDYKSVSWTYGIGMVVAVVFAQVLKDFHGDVGMLNGFSVGLAVIVFALAAKVFSEYAYKFNAPFDVNGYFKKYWALALGGLFYNAAIWVDKWIMWFAPESCMVHRNDGGESTTSVISTDIAQTATGFISSCTEFAGGIATGMRMYPDYDSATFLAYLTIIPAMAVFVLSVETSFFERYQRFYVNILAHKPWRKIVEDHKEVIKSIFTSARNFIVIQGAIVFLVIVLAPAIFEALNVNNRQIGIFRLASLGAFFHVLTMFEMIILSYFDCRQRVMWLSLLYLVLNAGFTLAILWLAPDGGTNFPYYGYGYLLASVIVFALTSVVLFKYIQKLPYHAFITNNNSITHIDD